MSEGQYQGSTVAIKCLKMKDGDHERMFKVRSFNPKNPCRSAPSSCPAIVSGDHRLETFISSKHFAPGGRFYLRRSASLPHSHRVDAQRKYCEIHTIQSSGKPLAVGEPAHYFLFLFLMKNV